MVGDQRNWLRRFAQEDMLASGLRMALSAAGPFGAVIAEFVTHLVPQQRVDRLENFVEQLNQKFLGLHDEFRERVRSSAPFAVLTEEATLAAVRTASDERRSDLAALVRNGFDHDDARCEEDLALARLLERLNEPQVLLLMSYGNFRRTMGDTELRAFQLKFPGVFEIHPPTQTSGPDDRRRWAIHNHYLAELVFFGLLEDEEGIAKSGFQRKVRITPLGRLLLQLVGRGGDAGHNSPG